MGLADWLSSSAGHKAKEEPKDFCSSLFPEIWSSFVNSVSDFGFTGQPCGTPEQAGVTQDLPLKVPFAERLVAVGDLHGDFKKTRRAFQLAGLTDADDRWIGGNTVCVQVGDILDRGENELRICYFLERLQAQALKAGGRLYVLNGNHETMNIMGDTRYAKPGAAAEFARWQKWQKFSEDLKAHCHACSSSSGQGSGSTGLVLPAHPPAALMEQQGGPGLEHFMRVWALQPGSVLTRRFFANHPTVLQVGSTLFVHGGILPQHVSHGFDRINRETRSWMLGEQALTSSAAASFTGANCGKGDNGAPNFLRGATAIVWARDFSAEQEAHCDCEKLQQVLQSVPGASRMVMGHTIQREGINAACDGRALRVDVGMSRGCGNREVEVLEVREDGKQVWRLRVGHEPISIASASSEGNRQSGSSTGVSFQHVA